MPTIEANLAQQRGRIADACARSGRAPTSVTLVAVSKGHGPDAVRAAWDAGQRVFGESYAQELRQKRESLADLDGLVWHFIGHVQTNKARELTEGVACVHTIDRAKLVREFDKRATSPLDVMIEVNVGAEVSKFGCSPDQAEALVRVAADSHHLRPIGFMTIAPYLDDAEAVRPYFRSLRELRDRVRESLAARAPAAAERFGHLSMGMSHDLEVAVEEGATLVRVGTAIFGERRAA